MTDVQKPHSVGAYDLIRGEILQGALQPDERLRVADLNARYALGLTPIREALMRLTAEGLVVSENHRGARVRSASLDELRDLTATRQSIERLCLERAMADGDAAWEAEILRAFHVLSRTPLPLTPDDRDAAIAWEAHHRAFHFALVAACGSTWLLSFWNTLADHSERYRMLRLLRLADPAAAARRLNAEHEGLMTAVIARDVALACERMDRHLAATQDAVSRLMRAQD